MARARTVSDLEAHVGYWLRFVSNHVSHAFELRLEAHGVTVAEWVLLRELLSRETTVPSHLAEQLGLTRGAVSKLIDRLSDKKLVKRTFSSEDRRYQSVSLTPGGEKLVPALAAMADENDRSYFGHLKPQQRDQFLSILKDIVRQQGWKDVPVD